METPEIVRIDEIVCLGSEASSFKRGKKNTNKLKVISKSFSKKFKIDESEKCLYVEKYQRECDN